MNNEKICDIKLLSELLVERIRVPAQQGEKRIPFMDSHVVLCSQKGPSRELNQDRVACIEIKNQRATGANLFVVIFADGMGGMTGEEEAASAAIRSICILLALADADGGLNEISEQG